MTDHDLRRRLAALDPVPPSAVAEPLPRGRAARILEDAVTQLDERPTMNPWYRRGAVHLAAVAAAVLAVGGGVALTTGDSPADISAPRSTLALNLPGGDAVSSCLRFDVAILADMSPALAGTVTAISPDTVTIEVDRWYAGGNADSVSLARPSAQSSVALDGVDFVQGKRYLLTAAGGTVNGCGYSGPATPELQGFFDEAFGD